jgi:hypothetical protein
VINNIEIAKSNFAEMRGSYLAGFSTSWLMCFVSHDDRHMFQSWWYTGHVYDRYVRGMPQSLYRFMVGCITIVFLGSIEIVTMLIQWTIWLTIALVAYTVVWCIVSFIDMESHD